MVLGYSRQAVYKQQQSPCASRKASTKEAIRRMVCTERKVLPRLGTRKLYHCIRPQVAQLGLKCGRDTLFRWLGEEDLLIKPQRRYIQTTNSKHHLRRYPNRIKGLQIDGPEQLWVGDITYVRTAAGWMYLSLLTDAFSRKVVGYSIADNMEATTVADALRMALAGRKGNGPLLHHSDRGMQYCSREYTTLATDAGLLLSMTDNGDPYENALAERMNRTFKEEFGLGETLPDKACVISMVQEAVALYNNRRPHLALEMETPEQRHKKIPATEAAGTH